MVSERRLLLAPAGLVLCGAVGMLAWQNGLWGVLTGCLLAALWLALLGGAWALPPAWIETPSESAPSDCGEAALLRALLESAPTPLVAIEGPAARTLNRAARSLFDTDDIILPVPQDLLAPQTRYLKHGGRRWRVDRVETNSAVDRPALAALIDVEQEERTAEARAAAELIQVLGHELLNGLAPIVSLAESGLQAASSKNADPALLAEILTTLARRAEGLQRFAAAYRSLARLPEPNLGPTRVDDLADDLARLFTTRWPEIGLDVSSPGDLLWRLDRDQLTQAAWALLQNAAEAVAARENPRVRLTLEPLGESLSIAVEDNGPGIPAGMAGTLFRPFHTSKAGGSGIGLSLARQIANAHGGSLKLETAAPTTFRLLVPQG